MTHEEKQLLLKDLCARLPYKQQALVKYKNSKGVVGTIININAYDINDIDDVQIILKNELLDAAHLVDIKPYLRPISSMTEEEWLNLQEWIFVASDTKGKIYFGGFRNISAEETVKAIDYLISHHFDYRGLIEKELALEAREGMYK